MFILICFVWYDILTYEVPQEQGYVFSSSVTFSVEWKVKGKKYENMNEENTWGKTSWENFKNISQFQLYYCKSFQCSEHLYNEKYDVMLFKYKHREKLIKHQAWVLWQENQYLPQYGVSDLFHHIICGSVLLTS